MSKDFRLDTSKQKKKLVDEIHPARYELRVCLHPLFDCISSIVTKEYQKTLFTLQKLNCKHQITIKREKSSDNPKISIDQTSSLCHKDNSFKIINNKQPILFYFAIQQEK